MFNKLLDKIEPSASMAIAKKAKEMTAKEYYAKNGKHINLKDVMEYEIISLMEEYAKQHAIEFGERLGKEELTYAIETSEWHNGYMGKSTKELYEQFNEQEEE